MKKVNQFLVLIYFGLLVLGCKSLVTKQNDTNSVTVKDSITIPAFEYHASDSDSILIKRFLDYNQKKYAVDSTTEYHSGEVFYPKDSTFKVLNMYGEYSGGATYNPYAESYIVCNNKIEQSGGEIFRIDKKTDSTYTFYADNFGRLGSHFDVYNVTFSKDSTQVIQTSKYPNFVYSIINTHKESQGNFPRNILNLLPKDEHKYTKNDTAASRFDENYYPDEQFVSRQGPEFYTQLFYRKKFGDQIEKVVRITIGDTIDKEITLAMRGGDSDSYALSSEFVNDSIFVQSLVNQETIKDDNEGMGYAYDSIVTKYKYNQKFDLDTIRKDTFHYKKEFLDIKGNRTEVQTYYSTPFKINKLNCYWETQIDLLFDIDDKPLVAKSISRKLINSKTKKNILPSDEDYTLDEETNFFAGLTDDFKDFNFDGYLDFSIYNNNKSGATHAFFDNFLFNPKTEKFVYSKELSGAEITVDKTLKTTTLFYNMGRIYHQEKTIHYTEKGNEIYSESYSEEEKKEKNSNEYYILKTYIKKKKGKIVQRNVTKGKSLE